MPAPRRNLYNASKAALVSMYETLRVEVGSDVGITIVTPGYLTVPAWFKVTYLLKLLCPELVEWSFRMMYMTESTRTTAREAPSKKILDTTGVKKFFYPSSIQSPDVKTEIRGCYTI
ncbi:11-beta-hydroxysteroid dehydrogenase 1B [Glycine max]|nr:11-beta-hydroxysteroid dehydrogenase 1B [Glycine max]KAH1251386.1 11-beta-hydroxysteroid dehydrogenase 1B [Glycine max]